MTQSTLTEKLHADDLFERLSGENEEEKHRKLDIAINTQLRELANYYEEALKIQKENYERVPAIQVKNWTNNNVRGFSSQTIKEFSLFLSQYEQTSISIKDISGVFLSLVINSSQDTSFELFTNHLLEKPDSLGYKNTKDITVIGDVGEHCGNKMEGGSIKIEGNAAACLGQEMRGGKIIIYGDAGTFVGNYMDGGEIFLEGSYVPLPMSYSHKKEKGNIYHKGKLIVKDGELVE